MRLRPTNLTLIFACALILGAIQSDHLLGQQPGSGSDYLIGNPDLTMGQAPSNSVQSVISDTPNFSPTTAAGNACSTGIACGCQNCATNANDAKPNPCAGSHKPVFYENVFNYLNDENYSGNCLGDQLKGIPVGQCGKLDIGGQMRLRYHSERGMGQQAGLTRFQDTENDFLLSRFRLYGDWKVNNRLRFYAEGIHAAVLDENDEYIRRGIDQNFGDLLNLFADVTLFDDTIVRVGRQELLFGAERLVSPLDWSNTRRTFDGVRVISKNDDIRVDAFYTQLVNVSPNDFDTPNEDLDFFGTYLTYSGMENKTLDLYALALNNDTGPVGTEDFVTYGSRLQGSTRNKLLYEAEGMIQTGRRQVSNQDLSAYAWTTGLGYQFAGMAWKPTLWGFYDFASGDGPGGNFNGFNDLFPLGHKYLGFIDAVQRTNIQSPNARLTMSPSKKLSLLFWYYNFQADEQSANVQSLGGTPAQDPNESLFGNELDIMATYNVDARSSIVGGYSHLWRGAKIIGDTDADFFYLQWTTNF